MNNLLLFLFQSVTCSLVFYAIYYLVLRNESCYRFNRYYLLASALLSMIIPLVRFTSPVEFSREVVAVVTLPEMVVGRDPYAASYTGLSWVFAFYALGIAFFTGKLVVRLVSVISLLRAGERQQFADYVLVKTGGRLPTFTFLKYVFWDETQPLGEQEQQQILRHELAHVKGRHTVDILLMEALHAVMWFNPLMYAMKSALVMTHEYEADETAAGSREVEAYQKLLARQVLSQYGLALGSHFNQSQTLKRLRMLANRNTNVYWGKLALPVAAMVMVFGVISCEHPALQDEELTIQSAAVSEVDGQEVFAKVEEQPMPPGGIEAFYTYVGRELKYPLQARRMGIEGKVFVQFVVDTDGSITDVQTIRGIGAGCDMESERVIAGSPRWNPGKQRGKAVRTRMILPVTFRLGEPQGEDKVITSVKMKIGEIKASGDDVFSSEK